jgi:5-methylthioadenosine/S-adenosylhomocysteine deaminase
MEPVDTLILARWVLPIEPDGRVLDNHAVAVRGGRIVAVLPVAEARQRFEAGQVYERPTHALLPGLVNAHTHSAMALLRGRAENLRLGPWLQETVSPLERRWADPEYVRDGTELAIAEMLRGGVTCFADPQLWPEVVARTAAELHIRVSTGLYVTESATSWASTPDEHIEKGMRLRDEYRGDPLVSTHLATPAVHELSDATLKRVRRLADELELPVAVPLHETAWEVERSVQESARRPLARLAELGYASPLLVAVHFTQAEPADIELLARAGASVIHCPESNLKLGSGVCPLPSLLGNGVTVALGTDRPAANNDLDVLGEARTAGLLASGVSAGPGSVVATDLLRMATLEGARVLGLSEATGSLLPGKWADLCCINLMDPRSWPVHEVAAALVYAVTSLQVSDTWVAGRRVFGDGRLPYLNEQEILSRAEGWRRRLQAVAEAPPESGHD